MQLESVALQAFGEVVAALFFDPAATKSSSRTSEGLTWRDSVAEVVHAAILIFCAEIGDKSFFLAMLLSTDYNTCAVFFGCFLALAASTLMAAFLGHLLSHWVDPVLVDLGTGLLFLGFALMLLWQWYQTPPGTEPEALEEAAEDINKTQETCRSCTHRSLESDDGDPAGTGRGSGFSSISAAASVQENYQTTQPREGRTSTGQAGTHPLGLDSTMARSSGTMARTASGIFGEDLPWWRVLGLAFTLNFVSELGDKTQFAVLAQATGHDAVLVALGAMLGFALVTGLAVMFGSRILKLLTQRKVLLLSMVTFAIFGIVAVTMGVMKWEARVRRSDSGNDDSERALYFAARQPSLDQLGLKGGEGEPSGGGSLFLSATMTRLKPWISSI